MHIAYMRDPIGEICVHGIENDSNFRVNHLIKTAKHTKRECFKINL